MEKKTKKAKENKQIVEIHIYIHQEGYQIPIYPICPIWSNPEPLPLSNPQKILEQLLIIQQQSFQ